jgi:hypothetical protein
MDASIQSLCNKPSTIVLKWAEFGDLSSPQVITVLKQYPEDISYTTVTVIDLCYQESQLLTEIYKNISSLNTYI